MRLAYLKIDQFKNLTDFAIEFDEASTEPVTVLLGRNGSGKSNLFEALVIIFRDLIRGKATTDFGYDLRYTLRGGTVSVRIWNPSNITNDANGLSSPLTARDGEPMEDTSMMQWRKSSYSNGGSTACGPAGRCRASPQWWTTRRWEDTPRR